MKKREQPGYYPGFSTLAQRKAWDRATRAEVEKRVAKFSGPPDPEPARFFQPAEVPLLRAVIDRVQPQSDRPPERRIRIFEVIDERLAKGRIDGQRFDNMPPDGEAYHLALQAVATMAREQFGADFTELLGREQDALLLQIHDAKPRGASLIWKRVNPKHFWKMLVGDCVAAYYSHPWAWDEIGYGGPAYPRAYTRIEHGDPEPWEVEEDRYEWETPDDSLSEPDRQEVARR